MEQSEMLTSCHGLQSILLPLIHHSLEQASRARTDGFPGIWFEEAEEKKGDMILPWDPPKTTQVRDRNDISISVAFIADLQFPEVGLIMHVPAENDGAEPKPITGDGEEFVLGHELPAKDPVDVYPGQFDLVVVIEQIRQRFERNFGG